MEQYATVLEDMQDRLREWMDAQKDPGEALDTWREFRNAKNGTHFPIEE